MSPTASVPMVGNLTQQVKQGRCGQPDGGFDRAGGWSGMMTSAGVQSLRRRWCEELSSSVVTARLSCIYVGVSPMFILVTGPSADFDGALIFDHIGGVPTVMVFDNATGVGRHNADRIVESKLFAAFKAHYRTSARYCNPDSGNEKGNVENAVGFLRRNLMVPEPAAMTLTALNAELLARCDALADKDHWRHKAPVGELFTADREVFLAAPSIGFDPVRYETRKTDKVGRIHIDGVVYLPGPAYHDGLLTVGIRHDVIDILDEDLAAVISFPRAFSEQSSTVFEPGTLLPSLKAKPGSWSHSLVRPHVPDPLADWLDDADHRTRSRAFAALEGAMTATDYATAMSAATSLLADGTTPDAGGLGMLARRLYEGIEPVASVTDLSVYSQYNTTTDRGTARGTARGTDRGADRGADVAVDKQVGTWVPRHGPDGR